ncbi:putative RNA-binding protein EEED8.10 [Amyelois transitella]|uniref:putative RNA-binding protein EEED8.10 n=1 Tax=Amyelois transitella TaxID=680683 RepID=UPI00067D4FF5|nr:putative RNA-binding protein EEED8.10 [Amyelois transitella]
MYFDEEDIFDDESYFNPEIYRLVTREFYPNIESLSLGKSAVPTHTEDGIPIRKLYVSNLPPKTTRVELFGVFVQYGFIKNCWIRMAEMGHRPHAPAYAFVTYTNPADAYKALTAPSYEKMLRGRNLKVLPADSWHQPLEDADGKVIWRTRERHENDRKNCEHNIDQVVPETSLNNGEASNSEIKDSKVAESATEEEPSYNILDILNSDCLNYILSFVPISNIIRSERVSKRWQCMVQEYLESTRLYKTSWWQEQPQRLTTAVLRHILARVGASLTRLYIDHPWSALNDRTAHTVGKFCPNLEELKIVSMHTKNWNPLIYGCKKLKSLTFVSCNKLTDSSLVHLVKHESSIEKLTVANNTHVTGLFLTGSNPLKLTSLAFYNCYSLQGTVLTAAVDTLPNLTTLKLDVCTVAMWKIVPLILNKLPKLQVLSLSEYSSVEVCVYPYVNEAFCESLGNLKELKSLNLSRNIYISNAVLKAIGQSCTKLETINVSSCNSRKTFPHPGVGDEGVAALCRGCTNLRAVDLSYLAGVTGAGVAALCRLPALGSLTARGLPTLDAAPLQQCLLHCHQLQEVDVCGCDNVSEDIVSAAIEALNARPRKLLLRVVGTSVPSLAELPKHNLLTVDDYEDTCNPNFRPDFRDDLFDSSDESYTDDMQDEDEFNAEDFFLDDDDDDDGEEDLEEYLYRFHYY